MSGRIANVYWLWLSAAVIVADQVTKQLVVRELYVYERIELVPFLNLVHVHNTGAAFSMFSAAPAVMFILLGVAVSIWILWWLRTHPDGERLVACALSLILGGALGNVIDRAARGHVIDFIDLHVGDWHWPAFNLADSAITVGAALLILDMLLAARRERRGKNP